MKELGNVFCWFGLACVVAAIAYKVGGATVGFDAPWGLQPSTFLKLATPVLLLAIASSLCCEKK